MFTLQVERVGVPSGATSEPPDNCEPLQHFSVYIHLRSPPDTTIQRPMDKTHEVGEHLPFCCIIFNLIHSRKSGTHLTIFSARK